MNLAIQTGRNFGPHGNRIAAIVEPQADGMQIIFWDCDREFGGVMVSHDLQLVEDHYLLAREIVRRIDIAAYDYGLLHPAHPQLLALRRVPWAVWADHKAIKVDANVWPTFSPQSRNAGGIREATFAF